MGRVSPAFVTRGFSTTVVPPSPIVVGRHPEPACAASYMIRRIFVPHAKYQRTKERTKHHSANSGRSETKNTFTKTTGVQHAKAISERENENTTRAERQSLVQNLGHPLQFRPPRILPSSLLAALPPKVLRRNHALLQCSFGARRLYHPAGVVW